jgi:hypothetical protein
MVLPARTAGSRRLGLAVKRGENALDARNVGRFEIRLTALLAHPRGQRAPVYVVAVAVHAERSIGALHLASTMHALHDHFLSLKSADH